MTKERQREQSPTLGGALERSSNASYTNPAHRTNPGYFFLADNFELAEGRSCILKCIFLRKWGSRNRGYRDVASVGIFVRSGKKQKEHTKSGTVFGQLACLTQVAFRNATWNVKEASWCSRDVLSDPFAPRKQGWLQRGCGWSIPQQGHPNKGHSPPGSRGQLSAPHTSWLRSEQLWAILWIWGQCTRHMQGKSAACELQRGLENFSLNVFSMQYIWSPNPFFSIFLSKACTTNSLIEQPAPADVFFSPQFEPRQSIFVYWTRSTFSQQGYNMQHVLLMDGVASGEGRLGGIWDLCSLLGWMLRTSGGSWVAVWFAFDQLWAGRAPVAVLGAGDASAIGTTEKSAFMSEKKKTYYKVVSLFKGLEWNI